MKKHVLVTLLMAALLVSGLQIASATNYNVNAAGTGGADTTIQAAKAKTVAGDTITITDAGTYTLEPFYDIAGLTLRGDNPVNRPTIVWSAGGWLLSCKNSKVENLILKQTTASAGWNMPVVFYAATDLTNVLFDGFTSSPLLTLNGLVGNVIGSSTISFCTTKNCTVGFFNADQNNDWKPQADDFVGAKVTFDHCTLMGAGMAFQIQATFGDALDITDPIINGGILEVKNSIIGFLKTDGTLDIARVFFSWKDEPPVINHHHNLYTGIWMLDAYSSGNVDVSDFAGMAAKGEIGAQGADAVIDPFNNLATQDFMLKELTSPALWKADDGKNMGSDIITVPVELSTFELQ